MAKKRLFKSKTNFTLKRLHQSGNYGNIYERDYTTISKNGITPEGQIPIYSSPSFKLSVRAGINRTKRYKYGNWLTNDSCGENGITWTLNCMPVSNINDSKIVLKPNSKRLTDFVCYGSSYEFVTKSIKNIIARFPAELYVTERKVMLENLIGVEQNCDLGELLNEDKNYYFVENPFLIDILRSSRPDDVESSTYVNTRYMCESYKDYNIINNDIITEINKWEVTSPESKECLINGDLVATVNFNDSLFIYCYYYEGELLYISEDIGCRIRLKDKVVDEFFNSLSDFEKILLNKETNYTSIFETYFEDSENGWYMKEVKYKWPIDKSGWNLMISGLLYNNYIDSLEKMANSYDLLYTDAIWRKMTHESITNMDLTSRVIIGDFETIDTDKIRKTINIIGRQFDEIKKYTDNIKSTTSISYDGNGNIPDYFIPDELSNKGWDVKEILNNVSEDIVTDPMFGSRSIGYTASNINNEILKRIFLNSKSIFKKKGTKQGIEELLSIFGFHSINWIDNNASLTDDEKKNLRNKSYDMIEYVYSVKDYNYNHNNKKNRSAFVNGVKKINAMKDSFEGNYVTDEPFDEYEGLPLVEVIYNDTTMIVPWFDKNKMHDSNLYFQMKGGWGRNDGNHDENEISVYDYTVSKIHLVNSKEDLYHLSYQLLDEHFYYYIVEDDKYFKIKDINLHNVNDGWEEVKNEEDILQIQNIIDYNKGNNPHTGEYDNGLSYVESFSNFFKKSSFNNVRDEDINEINLYGFDIRKESDNTKCLYFGEQNIDRDIQLRGGNRINPTNLFEDNKNNNFDEISSLSIINSKEFHMIFNKNDREFIETDVLSYLKQIIPSTTIFSYSFADFENYSGYGEYYAKIQDYICNEEVCPIYGVSE